MENSIPTCFNEIDSIIRFIFVFNVDNIKLPRYYSEVTYIVIQEYI